MQLTLYKDDVQARRVTAAAQEALANTSSGGMKYTRRHLGIAPETWAGTLAIWSMYNALLHQQATALVEVPGHNELLHQQATALVEVPCQQHGIPIQTLGEYPLFRGLKLVRGEVSDVVIVPADEDPLFVSGKFPLPQQVDQRLRAMKRAGVPCDMLYTYIAHEVPCGSVSEDGPLPLEVIIPPAPALTVRTSEHLGTIAHALTVTLLGKLGQAAAAGVQGAGALGLGAGLVASTLLDPLIFGAIADERGMATWFVLAQWAW